MLFIVERGDVGELPEARKKQADAPLSESERLLKEAAMLERDTNVKSSAMGVVPFEITQNVRDKLRLLQDNKFDWIAMVSSAVQLAGKELKQAMGHKLMG